VSQTSSASPQWLATDQLHPAPSARELDWLNEQGSLTRRLTALSADSFAVQPLVEGWQILRADECAALGVASGSEGWVREVYLLGRQQPWVFARSVAARSALERHPFALDRLGTTSLGHLLFRDPAFTRLPIEACRYPAALLPPAVRHVDLWGRRSLFCQGPLGVLVAEVFLPALWRADAAPRN
jgi:chorismate--pyruvate lyase